MQQRDDVAPTKRGGAKLNPNRPHCLAGLLKIHSSIERKKQAKIITKQKQQEKKNTHTHTRALRPASIWEREFEPPKKEEKKTFPDISQLAFFSHGGPTLALVIDQQPDVARTARTNPPKTTLILSGGMEGLLILSSFRLVCVCVYVPMFASALVAVCIIIVCYDCAPGLVCSARNMQQPPLHQTHRMGRLIFFAVVLPWPRFSVWAVRKECPDQPPTQRGNLAR